MGATALIGEFIGILIAWIIFKMIGAPSIAYTFLMVVAVAFVLWELGLRKIYQGVQQPEGSYGY